MSLRTPAITWGAGFSNTITIQYPVDRWSAYSAPREGSDTVVTMSGLESAWILGWDYYLEAEVRWIPTVTTPDATGWEGSTGWDAFLRFAKEKNEFRWHPDSESMGSYVLSYLVEPMDSGPTTEMDGTKSLSMVIRNPNEPYTGY